MDLYISVASKGIIETLRERLAELEQLEASGASTPDTHEELADIHEVLGQALHNVAGACQHNTALTRVEKPRAYIRLVGFRIQYAPGQHPPPVVDYGCQPGLLTPSQNKPYVFLDTGGIHGVGVLPGA